MSEQKFRVESDLIGELQVPIDAYYGVQTQRAINNYKISNTRMCDYPEYIIAMAYVKMAAAAANAELGVLDPKIADAIVACTFETYFSFASKELLRLKTGVFRNEKSPRFLLNFVWTSQGLNLGPPDYESLTCRLLNRLLSAI